MQILCPHCKNLTLSVVPKFRETIGLYCICCAEMYFVYGGKDGIISSKTEFGQLEFENGASLELAGPFKTVGFIVDGSQVPDEFFGPPADWPIDKKLEVLRLELKSREREQNFERCAEIRDSIRQLENT